MAIQPIQQLAVRSAAEQYPTHGGIPIKRITGMRGRLASRLFSDSHILELPPSMSRWLPHIVNATGTRGRSIDCAVVAHMLNDVPFPFSDQKIRNYPLRYNWDVVEQWSSKEASEKINTLQPGSTLIFNRDNTCVHWAVNCGNDQVLQKLGYLGPLAVSSVGDAAALYDVSSIAVVEPRAASKT